MLEAVKSGLGLLEVSEVMEVLEMMCCLLLAIVFERVAGARGIGGRC